jgi:hypothetical protein
MAKIVTDAGGIASDYFNKKAEAQDKATLTRITQEQNNLLSTILKNIIVSSHSFLD